MPEGRDRDYNSLYGFGGRPKAPRGKFDRLVTFMVPTVAETNDWNENVPGDPIETPVWAMIKSAPGTERFANAENAAVSLIRIFVRWRADLVNYTGHVKHDNRQYDVKSIQEIGRRELLEIIAVASADLYVYRIPPPANDTLPAIIGVAFPGVTLVASPGTWSGTYSELTYQWLKDGVAIPGATTNSYLFDAADEGSEITVEVSASNTFGSATATSEPVEPLVPLAISDFSAGVYSIGGEAKTLDDLWMEDAANWGAFDPETSVIPGQGLTALSVNNAGAIATPELAGALFPASDGLVIVWDHYAEVPPGGWAYSEAALFNFPAWDVYWTLWIGSASRGVSDWPGVIEDIVPNPVPAISNYNRHRMAMLYSNGRFALSIDGSAPIEIGDPLDFNDHNTLTVAPAAGAGATASVARVEFYGPQAADLLSSLSALPPLEPIAVMDFQAGEYTLDGEAKVFADIWTLGGNVALIPGQGLQSQDNANGVYSFATAAGDLLARLNELDGNFVGVMEYESTNGSLGADIHTAGYALSYGVWNRTTRVDNYDYGTTTIIAPIDSAVLQRKMAWLWSPTKLKIAVNGSAVSESTGAILSVPTPYNFDLQIQEGANLGVTAQATVRRLVIYGPEVGNFLQELSTL